MKKLEVGKDYANSYSSIIVIDRRGDWGNSGFEGKIYLNNLSFHNPTNWREATEEEVIEAFEKHLIHRYGEDWETMKIKEEHPDSAFGINSGLWCVDISRDIDGWNVENINGLLYCNGIWVERLEEPRPSDWTTPPKDFEYKKIKISSNVNKKRYEVIKTTFSDFKQVSLGDNKNNSVIAHFVNPDEDTLLLVEKIADILNLMEK